MLNTPSVVTVPAIGAEQLWQGKIVENGQQQEGATHREDKAQPPWIDNVISQFEDLKPKVIAYKHRELTSGLVLEALAEHFLSWLNNQKRSELLLSEDGSIKRSPTFFVCHSTGGLVVKKVKT
jgi:hypothetical protein